MKRFPKVLLSFLAAALIIVMLAGCATPPPAESQTQPTAPTAPVTTPEAPAAPAPAAPAAPEAPAPAAPEVKAPEAPAAPAPVPAPAPAEKEMTYRIIHTNNLVERAIASFDGGMGFAEVSAIVDYAKAGYPTLVLEAGSNPTDLPDVPLSMQDGALLAQVLDAIGYDAMTPGLQDLAFGVDNLKALDAATNMSILSANAKVNGANVFAPYKIYDINGLKVGVFGLTSPAANMAGVSVDATIEGIINVTRNTVGAMLADGADLVVALTNMGFEQAGFSEEDIAYAVSEMQGYVDLVIDGMGTVPYERVEGSVMYVQTGSVDVVGGIEVTVRGDKVVDVKTMFITKDDIAGLAPNAKVASLLSMKASELAAAMAPKAAPAAPVAKAPEAPAPAPAPAPAAPEVKAPEAPAAPAPAPVAPAAPEMSFYEVKAAGDKDDFLLTILHTNDTHGRLEEGSDSMGYAKIATVIEYAKSVSDSVLVLDAGDTFHGTNAATITEGESIALLMNGAYDALTPGNHDFNYGVDRLLELDAMTDFPFLSANVTKAGEFLFQPYKIFDFHGVKVAVFGLTTPETSYKTHPKNIEGVYFDQPPVEYLANPASYGKVSLAETARLLQAGVDMLNQEADIVIGLVHLGVDKESEITSELLAQNINGIDIIIDGHSHTELPKGLVVNGTVIAQTGNYGKNVGVINIDIKNKAVASITPFLFTKDESAEIEPNAAVQAYIENVNAEVKEFTSQVIAYTDTVLDGERAMVRTRATNLSNIITTAMLEATGADVALTNGGGIRASIDKGEITIGEVITVLPFNNTCVVIEVTGAEIIAALENGIKDLPNASGAFPQYAGMQVIWNRFKPAGERVFKVKINGKDIDKNATYKLATNDFVAAGGDQYTMFADKPLLAEYGLLAEVFGYYLVENFPVK